MRDPGGRIDQRDPPARGGSTQGSLLLATILALVACVLSFPGAASGADLSSRVIFAAGEEFKGSDWRRPDTYWAPRDLSRYTPALWRVLRRERVPLAFHLRYRRDFGGVPAGMTHRNDALPLLRKANRLRVPIWAWVVLPFSDGYWSWENVADKTFDATKAVVRWARRNRVRFAGVALDSEPSIQLLLGRVPALLTGNVADLVPLFQDTIDPERQCSALAGYARIVDWADRRGLPLTVAPFPLALDDLDDGMLALQDALDYAVPRAPWDEIYFQAYRSVFADTLGVDPGPGIVSSYWRSAQRHFGARVGQVALGIAGATAYEQVEDLVHDVRLLATLGAGNVPIYSLELAVKAYGVRGIASLAQAGRRPFEGSEATAATAPTAESEAARAAMRALDAAAVAATPTITAADGAPQLPNPWPGGCSQPSPPALGDQ